MYPEEEEVPKGDPEDEDKEEASEVEYSDERDYKDPRYTRPWSSPDFTLLNKEELVARFLNLRRKFAKG